VIRVCFWHLADFLSEAAALSVSLSAVLEEGKQGRKISGSLCTSEGFPSSQLDADQVPFWPQCGRQFALLAADSEGPPTTTPSGGIVTNRKLRDIVKEQKPLVQQYHQDTVTNFVIAHHKLLNAKPSAFISVSLSAVLEGERAEAQRYVDHFVSVTGWYPRMTLLLGAALHFTE
jgi:hypothetical protein